MLEATSGADNRAAPVIFVDYWFEELRRKMGKP